MLQITASVCKIACLLYSTAWSVFLLLTYKLQSYSLQVYNMEIVDHQLNLAAHAAVSGNKIGGSTTNPRFYLIHLRNTALKRDYGMSNFPEFLFENSGILELEKKRNFRNSGIWKIRNFKLYIYA